MARKLRSSTSQTIPLRMARRMTEEEKVKLENELSELREAVGELARRIENMDLALEPIRRIRREIEADIQLMYPKNERGIYVLNPGDKAGKEARKPLFSRLLYISEHHGREFNERKELAERSRAWKRKIERIGRELKRKKVQERQTKARPREFALDGGQGMNELALTFKTWSVRIVTKDAEPWWGLADVARRWNMVRRAMHHVF